MSFLFPFLIKEIKNLFLAALGLSLREGFSLVVASGLLVALAPLVAEHRLWVLRLQQLGLVGL